MLFLNENPNSIFYKLNLYLILILTAKKIDFKKSFKEIDIKYHILI
jgi:hypothetical protein